ncbi:MAG: cytochrome c oxidase subunit II [Bacteroidia bacterium]|nr:cytochrome c oxidase subunit II [Bacteroidia bacterium]
MRLLVIAAVILFVVVLVRLSDVLRLLKRLKKGQEYNEFATEKDNVSNGAIMVVFIIAYFIFIYWQIAEYGKYLLPEAASAHGKEYDWLWNVNMIIIFIPFIITHILLGYFALKYAGRNDSKAFFFAHSNKLEMIWTVIPAVVLTFIISYGLKNWNEMTANAPADATVVELYAKQFDWTARYSGKDNKLGDANYRLIEGINELGVNMNDGASKDDYIAKREIHIPIGKPVAFKFRSRDVIHSAYFPHFRAQMNCVPGMVTQFHFTPTITTAEMRKKTGNDKFDYLLLCNKICGAAHYNMQMTIIVDNQADYDAWVSQQKTLAETLKPTETTNKATEVAMK